MKFQRKWEMPNSKTFQTESIKNTILKYAKQGQTIIDPFANDGSIKYSLPDSCRYLSNDIDQTFDTTYHLDALDFLKMFDSNSVDVVLYDPPYSPRQVADCYSALEKTVTASDTRMSFWANFKNEIARVLKVGGIVITCGWNSNGIGINNGFEIDEILLVAHGGSHNDTIVTVERKNTHQMTMNDCLAELK